MNKDVLQQEWVVTEDGKELLQSVAETIENLINIVEGQNDVLEQLNNKVVGLERKLNDLEARERRANVVFPPKRKIEDGAPHPRVTPPCSPQDKTTGVWTSQTWVSTLEFK